MTTRRREHLLAALSAAGRSERRRAVAWLLAGALFVPVALAAGRPALAVAAAALCGGLFLLWCLRSVVAHSLARRDAAGAGPPPYRARVLLLHDPNPRAWRPLLAVWRREHAQADRWARPDGVYRADDDLQALESTHEEPVVHDAWVDGGRWSRSAPRWVLADAGLAVGHRWSLLGRWYVRRLLRRAAPPRARSLSVDPDTARPPVERPGSLVWAATWRVLVLLLVLTYVELRA